MNEWDTDIGKFNAISSVLFSSIVLAATTEKVFVKIARFFFSDPKYIVESTTWLHLVYILVGYFVLSLIIVSIMCAVIDKSRRVR